tara:strand:+ start:122 stop:475 length:354 start_codon:yes stop_codon:yes gene_type:complete
MTIGELIALPFKLLALIPLFFVELFKWVLDLPAYILIGAVVVGFIIYWVSRIVDKSLKIYNEKTSESQKETVNKSMSFVGKLFVYLIKGFWILFFTFGIGLILINIFGGGILDSWNS